MYPSLLSDMGIACPAASCSFHCASHCFIDSILKPSIKTSLSLAYFYQVFLIATRQETFINIIIHILQSIVKVTRQKKKGGKEKKSNLPNEQQQFNVEQN